ATGDLPRGTYVLRANLDDKAAIQRVVLQ
ncbi:MAG: hypothetical protein RL660_2143, partial [Bacteroidota bacterium]